MNDEVKILERVAPPGGQRRKNSHNRWTPISEFLEKRDGEIVKTYNRNRSLRKTGEIYGLSRQQIWWIIRGKRTRTQSPKEPNSA